MRIHTTGSCLRHLYVDGISQFNIICVTPGASGTYPPQSCPNVDFAFACWFKGGVVEDVALAVDGVVWWVLHENEDEDVAEYKDEDNDEERMRRDVGVDVMYTASQSAINIRRRSPNDREWQGHPRPRPRRISQSFLVQLQLRIGNPPEREGS